MGREPRSARGLLAVASDGGIQNRFRMGSLLAWYKPWSRRQSPTSQPLGSMLSLRRWLRFSVLPFVFHSSVLMSWSGLSAWPEGSSCSWWDRNWGGWVNGLDRIRPYPNIRTTVFGITRDQKEHLFLNTHPLGVIKKDHTFSLGYLLQRLITQADLFPIRSLPIPFDPSPLCLFIDLPVFSQEFQRHQGEMRWCLTIHTDSQHHFFSSSHQSIKIAKSLRVLFNQVFILFCSLTRSVPRQRQSWRKRDNRTEWFNRVF